MIKGTDERDKHKHKIDLQIQINESYKRFWKQDVSSISIDWDNQNLQFWIMENGYPYEPSIRSKGRQWHLAFYIKVSARAKEDKPNIILIDEPGLYLHAKAQKDVLEILEESAKDAQLLFSTHSPYLLNSNHLSRIRLVYRNDADGTKIVNKVHALADKETLTPILTAIGLELSSGIAGIDKENNIIVEGPSDVYYLNAIKTLLADKEINFIYGGGAGNMPFVGTILHGWGCKVLYLFDSDKGKKDGEKNLTKNWLITKELIMAIKESQGSIEDLFSKEYFNKCILQKAGLSYSGTNSAYIVSKSINKVLLAKGYLEAVQKGEKLGFDRETSANVTKLFDTLLKKIKE